MAKKKFMEKKIMRHFSSDLQLKTMQQWITNEPTYFGIVGSILPG